MKQKTMSKKEIRELNLRIEKYGISFDKRSQMESTQSDKIKILKKDGECVFFENGDGLIPSLKMLLKNDSKIKKITVDMGAVKFVTNGADIMRPGIVVIEEEISKDSLVVIIDENNKKPLAIGKSMYSSSELGKMKVGKVIKNIHYIGDKIWNIK